MNKTIKFRPQYLESILKKDKITTTRLFDDKDFQAGDVVDFLNWETKEKFAEAKISRVDITTFAELVKDSKDVPGMYEMYRQYYNREVKPGDQVKILHFDLIEKQ